MGESLHEGLVTEGLASTEELTQRLTETQRKLKVLTAAHESLLTVVEGQIVTIPRGHAKGMKWRLLRGYPARFAAGDWDQMFQEVMALILHRGDVFYDIGGNAGFHSLVASALVGEEGRVFCFEPVETNCAVVKEQMSLNHIGHCEIVQAAVGNTVGSSQFFTHSSNALGSTVKIREPSACIEVAVTTLNAFVKFSPRPQVVKIDVEGAEGLVVQGMSELLDLPRAPVLLIELHTPTCAQVVFEVLGRARYDYWTPFTDLDVPAIGIHNVAHIVAVRTGDPRAELMTAPTLQRFDMRRQSQR